MRNITFTRQQAGFTHSLSLSLSKKKKKVSYVLNMKMREKEQYKELRMNNLNPTDMYDQLRSSISRYMSHTLWLSYVLGKAIMKRSDRIKNEVN